MTALGGSDRGSGRAYGITSMDGDVLCRAPDFVRDIGLYGSARSAEKTVNDCWEGDPTGSNNLEFHRSRLNSGRLVGSSWSGQIKVRHVQRPMMYPGSPAVAENTPDTSTSPEIGSRPRSATSPTMTASNEPRMSVSVTAVSVSVPDRARKAR